MCQLHPGYAGSPCHSCLVYALQYCRWTHSSFAPSSTSSTSGALVGVGAASSDSNGMVTAGWRPSASTYVAEYRAAKRQVIVVYRIAVTDQVRLMIVRADCWCICADETGSIVSQCVLCFFVISCGCGLTYSSRDYRELNASMYKCESSVCPITFTIICSRRGGSIC